MAKHRTHSIELKRQVVQEFPAGESPHALAKSRSISRNRSTRPAASTATRLPRV
jgi:hypothetical protein